LILLNREFTTRWGKTPTNQGVAWVLNCEGTVNKTKFVFFLSFQNQYPHLFQNLIPSPIKKQTPFFLTKNKL